MSERIRQKILFVSYDKFPPFRVDVAVLFAKKLLERGHALHFLLQSDAPCEKAYQTTWSGCRAIVGRTDNGSTMVSRARKNLFRIVNEVKLLNLLKKGRYDFLICKDIFISAFLGLLARKETGTKFIYWLSYPYPEDWLHQAARGIARYPLIYWVGGHLMDFLLYRLVLPFADHVFVQSDQMRRDVAARGIPVPKMTTVPMGVEVDGIPFFGYELDPEKIPGEKIVLYLGTLAKVRRMDFLIRVFGKVLEKNRRVRLYLVGGGEDPSDEWELRKEAQRLGIQDAVVLTGFLPRHEAWELVRRADVCVSPFFPTQILNSTSPTKLIEYMAMGKAVVANDHPEQRAVMAESGAGLCVPYEEDAFSEAILYLLDQPRKAEEMGRLGRAYVESHRDYEIIADQVQLRLLELLEA
jgi:glycosyltransferase involved in cell wall biosynthesis